MIDLFSVSKTTFEDKSLDYKFFGIKCTNSEEKICEDLQNHFHCKLCDFKRFDRHFMRHLESTHLNPKYFVEYEGKYFLPCNVAAHMENVSEKRSHYHCPVCGKTVSQKMRLSAHLTTHLKQKCSYPIKHILVFVCLFIV